MRRLDEYQAQWGAQGRTPNELQHRGLVVAHRKARLCPWVMGLGVVLALVALLAVGTPTFRPWPTVLGMLGGAGLVLAGGTSRSAHVAVLQGVARRRQLSAIFTTALLACVLTALATLTVLAALLSGAGLQVLPLAMIGLLSAVAPWFIK